MVELIHDRNDVALVSRVLRKESTSQGDQGVRSLAEMSGLVFHPGLFSTVSLELKVFQADNVYDEFETNNGCVCPTCIAYNGFHHFIVSA